MAARVLFWGSGSPPCWRVQIALAEKQLAFDSKLLNFSKKEHKSAAVLAINPRGQLPAFQDGDVAVNDSLAAILYLEDTYDSGTQLLPDDATSKAKVYQRLMEVGSLQLATQGPVALLRSATPPDAAVLEEKLEKLRAELGIWEGYAAGSEFLAGSQFSLADVAAVPNLCFLQRMGAEFTDKYPSLQKYVVALSKRASVAGSVPPHWVDTPNMTTLSGV